MEITYDDVKKIYDNINTIISLNFLVFDEDNNLKYRFDSYEISNNIQDYEKYISDSYFHRFLLFLYTSIFSESG